MCFDQMLKSQGVLMFPSKKKFLFWEIWGTLHMVSELKVTTLGPQGKAKLV
jgi:hypothetical protein